jgi:phosphotransferase system HPr (HPr) family protein
VPDVTLVIRNPSGLHARPAALFVKTAASFASDLTITNLSRDPARSVNPKSLLALLTLGVSSGHEVRISADGADADAAIAALEQLVADGLGESLAT